MISITINIGAGDYNSFPNTGHPHDPRNDLDEDTTHRVAESLRTDPRFDPLGRDNFLEALEASDSGHLRLAFDLMREGDFDRGGQLLAELSEAHWKEQRYDHAELLAAQLAKHFSRG